MIEEIVDLKTRDGAMETFICHPERAGRTGRLSRWTPRHPRRALRYGRRLAAVGYYVVLPNLYYRAGRDTNTAPMCWKRQCRERAYASRADQDDYPAGDGGFRRYARPCRCRWRASCPGRNARLLHERALLLAAAARFSDRVAAAASFYGTWLVSDAEESPHLTLVRPGRTLHFLCRA